MRTKCRFVGSTRNGVLKKHLASYWPPDGEQDCSAISARNVRSNRLRLSEILSHVTPRIKTALGASRLNEQTISIVSQNAWVSGLSEYDRQIQNCRSNEGSNYENRSDRRYWTHRIKACQQAS